MENKTFSTEILEFSKLTDKVFNKISTDVKDLKINIDDLKKDKGTTILKKSVDVSLDKLNSDIKTLKNIFNVFKNNTDKELKKINSFNDSQRREINSIKSSVKTLQNKLKIRD
jgi:predicted patatin/cPLA2 family phospholipase